MVCCVHANADDRQCRSWIVDSKFALYKVHNAQYAVSGIRLEHCKITS